MIELPEAITIGAQVSQTLAGRTVTEVYGPTYLHKFTFFSTPPAACRSLLVGRTLRTGCGTGSFADFIFDNHIYLTISDGINARYGRPCDPVPKKYQMLVTFDDESFVSFTTSMYGSISVFQKEFDNKYRLSSVNGVSPLSEQYDAAHFDRLIAAQKKNITLKALLATEQRIPGVGNGVLQDILFNATLHPKRKIETLTSQDRAALFDSLKNTLRAMTDLGGRNTETDFLGNRGGYQTTLSQNTYPGPCPRCGAEIRKEAYMGGSVYYCPECQK